MPSQQKAYFLKATTQMLSSAPPPLVLVTPVSKGAVGVPSSMGLEQGHVLGRVIKIAKFETYDNQ